MGGKVRGLLGWVANRFGYDLVPKESLAALAAQAEGPAIAEESKEIPTVEPVDSLPAIPPKTPAEDFATGLVENPAPIYFVSGKAGSGKTYFIKEVVKNAKKTKNIVVLSFTGVAALNAGGQTVHSFFKFPLEPLSAEKAKKKVTHGIYEKIDLLFIDEISMVRADLFDAVNWFLQVNGPQKGVFMGGIPVIVVGDLYQLPPVIGGNGVVKHFLDDHYGGVPYFFASHCMRNILPQYYELTVSYRQNDPQFVECLDQIRIGKDIKSALEMINTRHGGSYDPNDEIMLAPTRKIVDYHNQKFLANLPGEEILYLGELSGKFSRNDDYLPAPLKLKLKVGARIMLTKNSRDKNYVNGSTGTILKLDKDEITVILDEPPKQRAIIVREVWEQQEYVYDRKEKKINALVVGSYTQFPIALGWAITIHKSQGKTFSKIFIDMDRGAFTTGQTYVALSRCKTLEGIKLKRPVRVGDVKVDGKVSCYYQNIVAGCLN